MIYSVTVLMPLLARLDQKLDPTSPITLIPKGNQNETMTQGLLQKNLIVDLPVQPGSFTESFDQDSEVSNYKKQELDQRIQ